METAACIQKAVDYIEENLLEELSPETIAEQAYMSSFHFQRLFSVVCNIALGEYIRSRRLTLAGRDVISGSEKIIDIALKYGYETPESFTRAFTRFHGIPPMAARSQAGGINSFSKISVNTILGGKHTMNSFLERSYNVRENGPVYYTNNMDRTLNWFTEVLGWFGGIDQRNENGDGLYGCVIPVPHELTGLTQLPFSGFHMFYGEASKQCVGFLRVDNVNKLYEHVLKSGWKQITPIKTQHWGGRDAHVTTIDGSVIRFYQLDKIS